MLRAAHEHSSQFASQIDVEAENRIDHQRLADALADLHQLLEEYAPSWYTQEHHEKVESALQLSGKL